VNQMNRSLPSSPLQYGVGDRGPNHRAGFGAPDQGALVSVRGGHVRGRDPEHWPSGPLYYLNIIMLTFYLSF
jgi:hypothetical protein